MTGVVGLVEDSTPCLSACMQRSASAHGIKLNCTRKNKNVEVESTGPDAAHVCLSLMESSDGIKGKMGENWEGKSARELRGG